MSDRIELERRLRSLAQEAIRCCVESVRLTRRSGRDSNLVDSQVLKRAFESLDEFHAACGPQQLLQVLGED